MAANQEIQTKSLEEQKKTTNWYLVGGIALATGLAVAATATVIVRHNRRTQVYEFEGHEEETSWTEDSQFLTTLVTATKRTFARMWGSTMSGLKNLDGVFRGYLGAEQPMSPLENAETVDKKIREDAEQDDEFFTAEF
jgi:hypothetical protein